MCLKTSDFGLARMFKEDESEANTKRIVGTLDYISPEYAVNGLYSAKKWFPWFLLFNGSYFNISPYRYAWRLYTDGRSLDLSDECLRGSSSSEVL
ncbi:putative non-specific protein-tyrosine kinase [Helianthus annuus]|nr:putative non-specific protein-tyrosine kinase [Helianthus annuus]